jgi:2-iminobutanoate/2-iminopropanoate deaminase
MTTTDDVVSGRPGLRALDPPGLPVPRGFSQTIDANGFVFVSGQLPVDADRVLVGDGDAELQVRRVFENVRIALEANGLGLGDIVKLTALVVTMEAYEAFRNVRDELFQLPLPTSTVGCVTEIVIPGAEIEIDAIAVRTA